MPAAAQCRSLLSLHRMSPEARASISTKNRPQRPSMSTQGFNFTIFRVPATSTKHIFELIWRSTPSIPRLKVNFFTSQSLCDYWGGSPHVTLNQWDFGPLPKPATRFRPWRYVDTFVKFKMTIQFIKRKENEMVLGCARKLGSMVRKWLTTYL